jgi:hypothetical protein
MLWLGGAAKLLIPSFWRPPPSQVTGDEVPQDQMAAYLRCLCVSKTHFVAVLLKEVLNDVESALLKEVLNDVDSALLKEVLNDVESDTSSSPTQVQMVRLYTLHEGRLRFWR